MKIKVFIEDEAMSNKKNLYNEKTLEYKKTVEVSREYPYPYGFILDTTSGDGDNLDCFVITNKKLKTGEIVECEVIGLMEQIETSWDPAKNNIEEEDHNVLAKIEDEDIEVSDKIKEKLRNFILHVFDHLPNKKIKVGNFLSKEDAIGFIQKCNDNQSSVNKIPDKTFTDPRVKMQQSPTKGQGLFAKAPIKKGETIIVWGGGVIVTNEEFEKGFAEGKYQPESGIHFDENHMLANLASEPDLEDAAINHSCDPNLWFENGWPLVARRDISEGEELTFDYATGETWPLHSECHCGAKNCRKNITGEEWKDPEFQETYKGHFNPYIQGLIDKRKIK